MKNSPSDNLKKPKQQRPRRGLVFRVSGFGLRDSGFGFRGFVPGSGH